MAGADTAGHHISALKTGMRAHIQQPPRIERAAWKRVGGAVDWT
jgi:hypothetical protein